ncbi:MAG: hypothetical protein SH868_18475 [Bythopirellula sp.]|nr:hypothetical protein [Bythopirellula sp.]
MKISTSSILARFGPGFSGFLGILLMSYGFLEPHRPWFIGGSILLAAAVIAARLGVNRTGESHD